MIYIIYINLRGVSTKLNKYIVFTMQTYKKLIIVKVFSNYRSSNILSAILFGTGSWAQTLVGLHARNCVFGFTWSCMDS